MNKKFKIALDCDDVLYECNSDATRRLNVELGSDYKINEIKKWGIQNNKLDERLKFFSDPEFVRNQLPMKGAQEFIHKLCNIAEVFICTSVPINCVGARLESIIKYFPKINPQNIIIGNRKDLVAVDVMLDDNPNNLLHDNVKYPVLYQQPWNYTATGLLSVSSYESFLSLIKKLQNIQSDNDWNCLIIIGPTGSGKKEYCEELKKKDSVYERVMTYSTASKKYHNHVSEAEFNALKECGFFDETSAYNGHLYGTRYEDIQDAINRHKIPVLILDINGALNVASKFKSKIIYIDSPKEKCIESIIARNIPIEEKVNLIMAIDAEKKNSVLCDEIIIR